MINKRKYTRRDFILISAVGGTLTCMGCKMGVNNKISDNQGLQNRTKAEEMKAMNDGMSRLEIMSMLDQKVNRYMDLSHHCAQSAFLALSEQFGYEDREIVKALTPMPGLAETGQTCGVVIGSLMALGLVYGRDRLDDWDEYRSSLKPAGLFVGKFQAEYGSLMCSEIVEKEFGRKYDLLDPYQQKEFVAAGATAKCSAVVRNGVRIAAGIILDETNK